jgi:gamma-glutamyltranspeptidase/glutathione hydrolase
MSARPPSPTVRQAGTRAVRGARGAVVAPHHLATEAGLRILAAGGSAVDAAVGTNAVLAVVMPSGCGLGGDAFWLVWDAAERRLQGLNGSGRAPSSSDAGAYRERGVAALPRRGPRSISVPGAVRSWGDAHARWGRLGRDDVLGDAIDLADRGFPAWPGFIRSVETTTPAVDAVLGTGNAFGRVFRPNGRPWRPGEPVRFPALAGTFRRLAADGFDAFYDGDLGARQAVALTEAGGAFSHADFRDQRSEWTVPLTATYRTATVATHPPNSVGVTGLQILRILERFEPAVGSEFGAEGWSDPRWLHLGIEATKRALVDRDRVIGDPAAGPLATDRLMDATYAATLARDIDPDLARAALAPVRALVAGTVFLATVDEAGNAVALIESNAAGFGSGVVDPETGIHYQNRGASFSLEAGHPAELGPGRRPPHSLVPAMTFRGPVAEADGPWIVHGSMGGDSQPQILAQFVSAVVDGRADIATGVDAPRWSVYPDDEPAPPRVVAAEPRFRPGVLESLEARGHPIARVDRFDTRLGHLHAIELVDGGPALGGSLAAATDPRSHGRPAVR